MTLHSLQELPRPYVPCQQADLSGYCRKPVVDMKRLISDRAIAAFDAAEAALGVLSSLWTSSNGQWKHDNNHALYRECCDYVDAHMELPIIVQIKMLGCTVETLARNGGIVP